MPLHVCAARFDRLAATTLLETTTLVGIPGRLEVLLGPLGPLACSCRTWQVHTTTGTECSILAVRQQIEIILALHLALERACGLAPLVCGLLLAPLRGGSPVPQLGSLACQTRLQMLRGCRWRLHAHVLLQVLLPVVASVEDESRHPRPCIPTHRISAILGGQKCPTSQPPSTEVGRMERNG